MHFPAAVAVMLGTFPIFSTLFIPLAECMCIWPLKMGPCNHVSGIILSNKENVYLLLSACRPVL